MHSDLCALNKDLKWWDCSAIIINIIIGTGIFSVFPELIAKYNPSTSMIMLTWFAGGIVALIGAMCYAELSSVFPSAGGDYTFLKKSYSVKRENPISFLFAWSQVFVIRPSSIVMLIIIVCLELNKLSPYLPENITKNSIALSLSILFFFTFTNMTNISMGKKIQNTISLLKVMGVTFIIFFGLLQFHPSPVADSMPFFPKDKSCFEILAGFWSALVLTMWVYGGWNEAVYVAEETKEPSKDIPRSLFFGIFITTVIYMGINFIYANHFTPEVLSNTTNPASGLMSEWFGPMGGVIMSIIIIFTACGAINALILTGGRITYSIANNFPKLNFIAILDPFTRIPSKALFANFLITSALLIISQGKIQFIESLTFYTAGVFWCFMGFVVVGLMLLRKKTNKDKIPYTIPFYPILPVIFLVIITSLIWASTRFKPYETITGIGVVLLGIPLYYFANSKSNVTENE